MKNIIALICFLFVNFIYAQSEAVTHFGFKAGYNHSDITGKETDGTPTGFLGYEAYVSLFSESQLTEKWFLGNEITFSFTDSFHYIEIPLFLKYQAFERWKVFAGPRLDFIITEYDRTAYEFNTFGYSIEGGVEFKINRKLIAEIRYAFGLKEQINDFFLDINDGKRNTFRVGIGFKF